VFKQSVLKQSVLKRFDEVLHELEQERQRVDEGLRDALRPGSYVSRGCDLLLGRLLLFFSSILRQRRVMMPKNLVLRLLRVLRGLILLRTLSRNPLVALFVVVLFDRRARRLAAGLLLAFMRNPRIRRLMLRWLLRR
jgi:hypothetical protein